MNIFNEAYEEIEAESYSLIVLGGLSIEWHNRFSTGRYSKTDLMSIQLLSTTGLCKKIETPVSIEVRPALTVRAPGGANHIALTLRRLLYR